MDWNKDKWIQGLDTRPVTEEEAKQAKEWGRILRHYKFNRVMTSEQGRAHETASLVNGSLNIPLVQDANLKERDWGIWSGKTLEQMMKEEPTRFEEQHRSDLEFRPPGGEGNDDLARRILLALKEAHMKFMRDTILVVIHEDTIRCIISKLIEDLGANPQITVVYLSNQLHWLFCFKGEIRLERMNALPLPMARIPK
jgi:broad specificity phosphatase PhoE